MFWKKKKTTEEIFSFESVEKRASFRVAPLINHPIRTVFRGQSVIIADIGAAGLSFFHETFKVGDIDQIQFTLPGESKTVSVRTEIINIDGNGRCHCRFHDIDEGHCDAIHRYMLSVQLAQKRSLGTFTPSATA